MYVLKRWGSEQDSQTPAGVQNHDRKESTDIDIIVNCVHFVSMKLSEVCLRQ